MAGNGTPPHINAEVFKSVAGVDLLHVAYKGGGPALTDLIGVSVDGSWVLTRYDHSAALLREAQPDGVARPYLAALGLAGVPLAEDWARRRLRIVKYRGTLHGTSEYPFLIGANGLSVLPITSLRLDHEASSEKVSTGER